MRIGRRLWVGAVFVLLSPLAAMGSPGGICNPAPAIPGVGGLPMVCAGCHGNPTFVPGAKPDVKVCLKRVDEDSVKVTVSGGCLVHRPHKPGFNLTVVGATLTADETATPSSQSCAPNQVTHKARAWTVNPGTTCLPPYAPIGVSEWTIGYSADSGTPVPFVLSANAGEDTSAPEESDAWTLATGTVPDVGGEDVCSLSLP